MWCGGYGCMPCLARKALSIWYWRCLNGKDYTYLFPWKDRKVLLNLVLAPMLIVNIGSAKKMLVTVTSVGDCHKAP